MSAELCPPHGAQEGHEEAAGLAVHVSAFALKSLLGYGEQGRFGGNQRVRQLSSTSVNNCSDIIEKRDQNMAFHIVLCMLFFLLCSPCFFSRLLIYLPTNYLSPEGHRQVRENIFISQVLYLNKTIRNVTCNT
jgi:hypothetical protein